MAFVKLGMALLTDELRQSGVAVQLNPNQALKVCLEQKGRTDDVRILVHDADGILRPLEGVPQAAWREFSMAEPTDGG